MRGDADMAGLLAERGAPIVLMHMLGLPKRMQQNPTYDDVVMDVWSDEEKESTALHSALHRLNRAFSTADAGIPFSKSGDYIEVHLPS